MIYTHVLNRPDIKVTSPLDSLWAEQQMGEQVRINSPLERRPGVIMSSTDRNSNKAVSNVA
jgi:hypothetical protein